MAPNHAPSPGNDFSSGEPPMRRPHLEFIYRIVAEMDPGASPIPNVQGTAVSRIVLPIAGGTVRGPQINGEIVKNSGADWAQRIDSPKVGIDIPPPACHSAETQLDTETMVVPDQAQCPLHPKDRRRPFHLGQCRGDRHGRATNRGRGCRMATRTRQALDYHSRPGGIFYANYIRGGGREPI